MSPAITNGFPLRRCSWLYSPIVSTALTRRMLRSLDKICLKRIVAKA